MQVKYKNRKSTVGDITFDSIKEAKRYSFLKALEDNGVIFDLKMQEKYELIPKQRDSNGKAVRAINYIADFTYTDEFGNFIVEDVKGFRTKDYIMKKKMMLWFHGIEIQEV